MRGLCGKEHVFLKYRGMSRKFLDDKGVSPVIAVILLVAITVVLVSLLYVMVSNLITSSEVTPRGVLIFTEDEDISGKYIGDFQGSVKLGRIEITAFDASLDTAATMDPLTETSKSVPGGLNISFVDANDNEKLDGTDTIFLEGAASGDLVTIMYRPTGETVAYDRIA